MTRRRDSMPNERVAWAFSPEQDDIVPTESLDRLARTTEVDPVRYAGSGTSQMQLDEVDTEDRLENLHHVLMNWTRTVYTIADLAHPFAFNQQGSRSHLAFYAVVSGRCELDIADECPISLKTGHLLLLRDVEARLSSNLRSQRIGADTPRITKPSDNLILMRSNGNGDRTIVLSGSIQCNHSITYQLYRSLSPVNLLDASDSDHAKCISKTLHLISTLVDDLKKGDDMLIKHLADALLIETVRALLLRSRGEDMRWLPAIQDRQIGIAMGLMHDAPGLNWSLVSLANGAGMSRSAFADRFTQVVGQTPMHYLTQLRMSHALTMLARDGLSVGVLAARLGYSSEASFSRAFRRLMGFPPSSVRRSP